MVIEGKNVYVSVAHRYWNMDWDAAKNREVYGRDASREGLGANLLLVGFAANPGVSPLAGLEPALNLLKTRIDHHSLFDDFSEFKQRASTLEAIAVYLGAQLFGHELEGGGQWHSLEVWETPALGALVWPESETMRLKFRRRNLLLTLQGVPAKGTSELLRSRRSVEDAVERAFARMGEGRGEDFAHWLFNTLAQDLPELMELTIDLGRHKSMSVSRQDLIVPSIAP